MFLTLQKLIRAMLADPDLAGPRGRRRDERVHVPDPSRSEEWNAWRERQALHPVGVVKPIGRKVARKEMTRREVQARRSSTRSARARAAREQAVREAVA